MNGLIHERERLIEVMSRSARRGNRRTLAQLQMRVDKVSREIAKKGERKWKRK